MLTGARPLMDAFAKKYPYWRVVSTRGFLQEDRFLCSINEQKELLEAEGHIVVPCGPEKRSLKVENYKASLFDFREI